MDREADLKKLNDMRLEILKIYSLSDDCKKNQEDIERLINEKENPAPPTISLKNENTHDELKEKFECENRVKMINNRTFERVLLILNTIFLIIVVVIFFADFFLEKGIIIDSSVVQSGLGRFNKEDYKIAFVLHIAITSFFVIFPIVKYWRGEK